MSARVLNHPLSPFTPVFAYWSRRINSRTCFWCIAADGNNVYQRQSRILSTRAKALQSGLKKNRNDDRTTRFATLGRNQASLTTGRLPKKYEACVVGAGPAGVTVMGSLLQRGLQPILWVDDSFNGGRINASYREVPSNTKVKLFSDFGTAVSPFRDIVGPDKDVTPGEPATDGLTMFNGLDPEKGCKLSHAADMVLMLTEGLKQYPGVEAVQGRLTAATLDDAHGFWKMEVSESGNKSVRVEAERLVLCTGSSPNNSPLPVDIPGIQNIDLDTALSPSKLTDFFSSLGKANVAVIGASHSAVLVLRNLYRLAKSGKADIKIKWFTRHELRYAEYMDGWILRDNTGLKGEAATWAQENLEPDTLPKSDVSNYLEKIAYKAGDEKAVFADNLADTQYYVQAIGFDKNPIPDLTFATGGKIQPEFDHEHGTFNFANKTKQKIKGLFGAGIAWPERVEDPYGNVEYAVGFFKFMKFVQRVSPAWN